MQVTEAELERKRGFDRKRVDGEGRQRLDSGATTDLRFQAA